MAKRSTTLAQVIRDAIENDGRSLNAIAKAADVAYQSLHPFVRGQRDEIALSTADRICRVVGLELRPVKRPEER